MFSSARLAFQIPNFVGRELADIYQKLHSDGSNGTVVLQGLAGIGKTQLAVKYALQHQHDYAAVFWLDAADPSTLESSFVNMMNRILSEDSSVEMLGFIDDQISYLNKLTGVSLHFAFSPCGSFSIAKTCGANCSTSPTRCIRCWSLQMIQ